MDQQLAQYKSLFDKSIFSDTIVELTWPEVKQEAENNSLILFPISVVEEHGPHLDLSPDIYGANILCKLIKFKLAEVNVKSLIAPPYYWGINKATIKFPGSFTVKPETFRAFLVDTVDCLNSWGFSRIFTITTHGDSLHRSTLQNTMDEIRTNLNIDAYDLFSLSKQLIKSHEPFRATRTSKFNPDIHAGSTETALMWTYYPDKVNIKVAKQLKPQSSFEEPLGYVGDPASFELENEKDAINKVAEYYVQAINIFLNSTK